MGLLSRIFGGRREKATARLRARLLADLEREYRAFAGGYEGASKSRPYTAWSPGDGSPDEDILDDLPELRARSRWLSRNDPLAAGMVETWVDAIVGKGLFPQCRIDRDAVRMTEAEARRFQRQAEGIYRRHAKHADFAGRVSHPRLQRIAARSLFENGDVFWTPRPRPLTNGRRWSTSIHLLEADRVMTPTDRASDISLRAGVKVSDDGEHLGYWVARQHPGDLSVARRLKADAYRFIPTWRNGRRQVFQVINILRPDQTRGVPFLASALSLFKDLKDYFRAELFAAKVAACFALFVVTGDPYQEARAQSSTSTGQRVQRLEPGMIKYLSPGESIEQANPSRPGDNFDRFVKRGQRIAGLPVQMPYEEVAKDFSETTYTSGRMALMGARRVYRGWQDFIGEEVCQPYYERLLEEAYLRGDLEAPGFLELRDEYTRAAWVGQGFTYIDPQKEIGAILEGLGGNITTLSEVLGERGQDWEEVLEQRAREREKLSELGLTDREAIDESETSSESKGEGEGLEGGGDDE